MTPLRIVAVDDEPLALKRLQTLINEIDGAELAATASGVETGIAAVRASAPDLLLLDVQMRDGDGFELLEGLPADFNSLVAFTTAFPRYAVNAFRCEAIDYLLKPIGREDLAKAICKARAHRAMREAASETAELREVVNKLRDENASQPPHHQDSELWVRHRGTDHVRVPLESIDYITSQDDYACIHVAEQEHLIRTSLDRLLDFLPPGDFTRIHRSTIVRNDRIRKVALIRSSVREIVLHSGTRLPVGRVYSKNLRWRSSMKWSADAERSSGLGLGTDRSRLFT